MRKLNLHRIRWLLVAVCVSLNSCLCETQNQQWSKPIDSISAKNNDWIPVEGKCPTCRPSRDLDAQATNEQINKVLSPPRSPSLQPLPTQQVQFLTNKQPRVLPFGANYPQFNSPFVNENKPYQLPPTKLFPQEGQKQFYQYENGPFVKQPFSLGSQQLIGQSPSAVPQPQVQHQRHALSEPYPFTLPTKTVDATTPKASYQPKIRFPDSEPPKFIPNNKITAQNTEEIQLLYVPVETLQRGRKNMKDLLNQNQYQQVVPHGFVPPQYNLQYAPVQKQQEGQFFFPPGFSTAPNYIQLSQAPPVPQKQLENVYANLSKNNLQPYFTINGLYSTLPQGPQVQALPTKQPDLQFYNLVQPGFVNSIKAPDQQFKPPPPNRQPNLYEFTNLQLQPQNGFIFPELKNLPSTYADAYTPTTTETSKSTYVTEKSTFSSPENKYKEFEYQYVTTIPQTSASQNQHFIVDNKQPKQVTSSILQRTPQTKVPTQAPFEDVSSNYPVPHQPPLSFYMEKLHNSKINDVLYLLKDAKTIPVLDTVESDPPQVFVGPSELQPPKGYIKFELPYLSSLDYNRIERMIDRLPFFVAPLNFKPPPGYSKIPFPAPHIGSVVLSNSSTMQESLHDKSLEQKYKPLPQTFPTTPDFSTITPQLTSQINSLLDTPSSAPADPVSFHSFLPSASTTKVEPPTYRTYPTTKFDQPSTRFQPAPTEEVKKPGKSTYKPSPTTESPKRVTNRQRKPIYRGYPSTTESATRQTTTSTESAKLAPKDTENYVEFAAKGTFNINNGNDNVLSSPTADAAFQSRTPSSSLQPPVESSFDFANFFSTFSNQNSQPTSQEAQLPSSQPQNLQPQPQIQNSQPQNQQPENLQTQQVQVSESKTSQTNQYFATDPFYSSQSPNEVKSSQQPQFQTFQNIEHYPNNNRHYPYFSSQTVNEIKSSQAQKKDSNIPSNSYFSSQPPTEVKLLQASQDEYYRPGQTPDVKPSQPTQDEYYKPGQSTSEVKPSQPSQEEYYRPGQSPSEVKPSQSSQNEYYSTVQDNSFSSQSEVKSDSNATTTSEPVNFSNIKPLSQYDPYGKENALNATDSAAPASTSNQQTDSFQFWNQNQFYNVNPAAVEYFSSTAAYQPLETTTTSTTSSAEPSYVPDIQKLDQNDSSTESTERSTTNSYRFRQKQRIQPNRYHQSRHTTEKENIELQSQKSDVTSARNPVESPEITTNGDTISQSTENHDFSTKHRRRRPNRPQFTNEVSSSTARNYRTRPNRYQTASSTERYRVRRPTTSSTNTPESGSLDWGGYVNNFAPSAPASNEITVAENRPRTNSIDENLFQRHDTANRFWTDPVSGQQTNDASPTTHAPSRHSPEESNTEPPSPWAEITKQNTIREEFSHYTPTVHNQQFLLDEASENKTVVERKDENPGDIKSEVASGPKGVLFEESNSNGSTSNFRGSQSDDSGYQSEKSYDQDVRKEKFGTKDGADGQKKAYDPQDEKKVSGI